MTMRVAVVHDWLVTYAGSERVLEQILHIYPDADLFTLCDFLPNDQRKFIGGRRVMTSFIQDLPLARRHYRKYLPLMPLAIEQFDFSSYDLVISSSHAVAKGVLTGPDQMHVSYVHSPMRYAWDMQHQYLRESDLENGPMSWATRWLLHKARIWDVRTAFGVDLWLSNSKFIARRVKKIYGCTSRVIYPPVDTMRFIPVEEKHDFYLTASRMVPYKRVGLIVEAFGKMPDRRLVVVGDGPDLPRIRAMAAPNVTVLGYLPERDLQDIMGKAKAFVFAAEEDFGITLVEAQACGTPVIAYGKGGALESVIADGEEPTGIFFPVQAVGSLCAAVELFARESGRFKASSCRRNAERFSIERFRKEMCQVVEECLSMPA
jgi:glycosyltransferase involved in cell wall biosynthesis